jgi:hypothetical protein
MISSGGLFPKNSIGKHMGNRPGDGLARSEYVEADFRAGRRLANDRGSSDCRRSDSNTFGSSSDLKTDCEDPIHSDVAN